MDDLKPQVSKAHYSPDQYLSKGSWMNYYYQIVDTLTFKPESILVIGTGDSVVVEYFRNMGLKVDTFDLDSELHPTYTGDIRNLPNDLKNSRYDAVICAHVLEHIPFEDVDSVLKELSLLTKYLIVQLPPSILQLGIGLYGNPYLFNLRLNLNIPLYFWRKYKFNGQHYWQPYRKGTSMKKVKLLLGKYFKVLKEYQNPENHYSYHFILKSNEHKG
jgi:hypothetical protein